MPNLRRSIGPEVGARIRRARERVGLNQSALARLVDRSPTTISLWEAGRREPGLEDLVRLGRALEVDPGQFLDVTPPTSMRMVLRAEASRVLLDEVVEDMEPFAEAAEALKPLRRELGVTSVEPLRAARELLEAAGVDSPPVDVYDLARRSGVQVLRWEFDEAVSGLLLDFGGRAVIGVNKLHAVVRKRFTVAHELGHYLLNHHRHFHIDLSNVDGDPPGYDPRDERAANAFAAELLMPAAAVAGAEPHTTDVLALAKTFQVSRDAMGFRLVNLGFR